ncbi:MAG: aspartate aminotransferase family protein [Firmicutes bacterium]|nr:aspartate aminotransferase family protein [Bacillota bacterium]
MNTFEKGEKYVMHTYNRFPLAFTHGEGMYVYDEDGKAYLDFVAGIAVNSLGHNYKPLVDAIADQASKMIHISNLYYTKPQTDLAEKLVEAGSLDKVFYCNSGAESIEAALKLARKYGSKTGRQEIITMEHSFHGRTFGAVTATGQPHYHEGFGDMLPHIKYAVYNDIESLKNTITDRTVAVLFEPVQGEGGIHPAEQAYIEEVRKICTKKDILLIFDEVQCGVGRLGTLFAYQYFDVVPDIMCTAKGIAGGMPCGIMMAKARVAQSFQPGDHASTFGGNPLATAAGNVVVDTLLNGGVLDNVKKMGEYLSECLEKVKNKYSFVTDARGVGLMQGIELDRPVGDIVGKCISSGLLLVNAGKNVIRFVPSLIVSKEDIDKAMEILDKVLSEEK